MVYEVDLKMKEIITNENDYSKIDTPDELIESLDGNGKASLVSENEEVQTWILEDKEYYFPVQMISKKMCYTKK